MSAFAHEGEQEVVVKDIVLEHISDSYEWHIGKFGEKHVAIPLPVIVNGSKGWRVFSSSHLHHGGVHEGFTIASEGNYAGKIVEIMPDGSQVKPFDISITKTVAGLLINSTIVILLILGAAAPRISSITIVLFIRRPATVFVIEMSNGFTCDPSGIISTILPA